MEQKWNQFIAILELFFISPGTPYHVSKLDHEKKEIHVEETKAEYYTKALVNSEIFIKEQQFPS
jgi:hypothetical protein